MDCVLVVCFTMPAKNTFEKSMKTHKTQPSSSTDTLAAIRNLSLKSQSAASCLFAYDVLCRATIFIIRFLHLPASYRWPSPIYKTDQIAFGSSEAGYYSPTAAKKLLHLIRHMLAAEEPSWILLWLDPFGSQTIRIRLHHLNLVVPGTNFRANK